MRSRISFFNKVIFKKNMTMYWPLPVCYLLYGVIKLPASLWLDIRRGTGENNIERLAVCLNLEADIIVAAVMALLCGMLLFSYLFKAESAGMMHMLPVTRTELFGTNVISGLTFMFVPQFLVFLLTMFVSLSNGITQVQFIGMWLLSVFGVSVFWYALVCFCVMFTGQLFALPAYFIVLNFLAVGIFEIMRSVFSFLGYGIGYNAIPDITFFRVLYPYDYLGAHVGINPEYTLNAKGDYVVSVIHYTGAGVILGYFLAALLFYVLAWYGYKKRRLESAGDLLTFQWVKPVFRWGVGFCSGYLLALVVGEFLEGILIPVSGPLFYLLVSLFTFLGFFIAEMFVRKSFRVFTKKRFREYALFFTFVLISFAGISVSVRMMEQHLPGQEQIVEAYIEMNYPLRFSKEDTAQVIKLHRKLIENKDNFWHTGGEAGDTTVSVSYRLKDGKTISRLYVLPTGEKNAVEIAEQIYGYEIQPEFFMQYLIGSDYADITDIREAAIEGSGDMAEYIYTSDSDAAKRIYEAALNDIRAQNLQKYNLHNVVEDADIKWQENYPSVALTIDFKHPYKEWQTVYEQFYGGDSQFDGEDKTNGYIYMNFGEDCTSLIQALIDEGLIRTPKDLDFHSEARDDIIYE